MPDLAHIRLLAAFAALALLTGCGEGGPGAGSAGTGDAPLVYNGAASAAAREEDPGKLVGLDLDTIHDLLGDPALVRRDGSAEVWQYRSASCVLDLFIYGPPKAVAHVDLRDRGAGTPGAMRACFAAMLKGEIPAS